ncbi:hypothetical protein MRB53_033981 [Persea americana]|uniref:Uncharacterized protein n=1 Tax=Persea americana TaxID=3435 RepID=A0ACC2KW10_PERAE|nr:hypothetical protein MRB53_033981 [Persea americana]
MGTALMNNCNPVFQATTCLKRCGNGYSHGDLNAEQRCFRSNNSSTGLQYKNSGTIELSSDSEDENQNMFLKVLGEKFDAGSLEADIDLGYKMFLEHAREDGKSYVLEMLDARDGKPVCVTYEGDEVSSDEGEIPIRSKSDEGDPQNQMNSDGISNKGRSACQGKKNQESHTSGLAGHGMNRRSHDKSGQSSLHSSSTDNNQENESLVDESYQTFLNHVKVHGDSLVVELENGGVFKYEEVEVRTASSGEDVLSDRREILTKRKYDEGEPQDKRDSGILLRKRTCPRKKKQKSHTSGLISNGKNKSTSDESGQIILHSQENESLVDESYQIFLNHVSVHGYSLVLELDNGVVVKYEEENEVCATSKGSPAKSTPCCSEPELESHTTSQRHSDSFACEHDASSLKSVSCDNQFQFKEELMACLDRPFDQEEHDMLLDEAKTQKILERSRDLRSRSVSYATKRRSFSYFDHYPDLERQIKFANPHRSLTLLRGFFFWLKNLSHEGAFPPWRTLPADGQIVPFSTNEMATPVQIEIPEGIKEESDMQLVDIEMPVNVKVEETDMQPIQIGMAEGIEEVTDIQPIDIEIISSTKESVVQPIEISA